MLNQKLTTLHLERAIKPMIFKDLILLVNMIIMKLWITKI